MIAVPIWALLALILVVIVFALLVEAARRQVVRLAQERDVAVRRIGAARLDGYTDGSLAGYKRGWGAGT